MYKIKTLWYSQLNKQCHIVTSAVTGKSTAKHEKTIWHMVRFTKFAVLHLPTLAHSLQFSPPVPPCVVSLPRIFDSFCPVLFFICCIQVLDSQLDDLKVWISEEERQVLTAFAHDLQQNVEKTAARMQSEVSCW